MDLFEFDRRHDPFAEFLYSVKKADEASWEKEYKQRRAGISEDKIEKGTDNYEKFNLNSNYDDVPNMFREYIGKELFLGGNRRKTRRYKKRATRKRRRRATRKRRHYY